MKRMLVILLALLMLSGAAAGFAEEADCLHKYQQCEGFLNTQLWIVEKKPEAFLASAICTLCGDEALIVKDKTLLAADPCEPGECTHRLYLLPAFSHTSWQPAADDAEQHVRVTNDVGVCLDCGVVATVFSVTETGEHRMQEKAGFHIEGQYIHVTCQECELCGLMTGALVPCISYEDGGCDHLPAQE